MADRRNYNGLHLPGGQQQPSPEQQVKMAIGQLTHEIYVRASADLLMADPAAPSGTFEALAEQCQIAARAYFVGLGVITVEHHTETEQPVSE